MIDKGFEIEVVRKVFAGDYGEASVGPDRDGLGLIEINSDEVSLIMTPQLALGVAEAMTACAREIIR